MFAGYHCRMRIITLNVNGIRSAARRGLFPFLETQKADVICLQETRALEHQLEGHECSLPGYLNHFYAAERLGYAGVAALSRHEPKRVLRGFKVDEFDREGRYLELQFDKLSVISLYLPSGSAGPERQASKFRFLEAFMPHLRRLRRARREYIICGDWNIAHKPIDLKNWKSKSGPGWTSCWGRKSTSTPFARWCRSRITTPGGRIAGRHGRRMSAGGLITRY